MSACSPSVQSLISMKFGMLKILCSADPEDWIILQPLCYISAISVNPYCIIYVSLLTMRVIKSPDQINEVVTPLIRFVLYFRFALDVSIF